MRSSADCIASPSRPVSSEALTASYSLTSATGSATPSSTTSRTLFSVSRSGSCGTWPIFEIGRATCRERRESTVVDDSFKKKKKLMQGPEEIKQEHDAI